MKGYSLETDDNARKAPVRLVVVQGESEPAVDASDEPQVMSMPHLFLREGIALVVLSLGLVLLAIFVDAPLEEIANPLKTPNPAKAPGTSSACRSCCTTTRPSSPAYCCPGWSYSRWW